MSWSGKRTPARGGPQALWRPEVGGGSPDRRTGTRGGKGRTDCIAQGERWREQGTRGHGQRGLQARGPWAQGPACSKADSLTLFFVIVFPGLAVVGLAALRLALLACAENTEAIRHLHRLWAPLRARSGPHGPGRQQQAGCGEPRGHPGGVSTQAAGQRGVTKIPERRG